MIKVTQLISFATKSDAMTFYQTGIQPSLKALNGLLRYEASEIVGLPLGSLQPQILLELYFENEEAMEAAFAGGEGRKLVRELTSVGGKNIESFESRVFDPSD